MSNVKNVSGENRITGGRLVLEGVVIEVLDEDTYSYTCQPTNWAPADEHTQALHDAAVAELEEPVEPSESWTVNQLRDHAEANDVDLGTAKTKAEILAAINKES